MGDVFIIDKALMAEIINRLKTIHPTDFDGMNKLVGCVLVLEEAMNPPKSEQKTEEIKIEEVADNG